MVSIGNCVIVLWKEGGMEKEWGESLMALLLFSFEHDICNTFQGKSWESCYKAATLLLSVAPFSNFSVLCHFGFVVWWYRPDSKDPGAEVPVYSVFKYSQVSSRQMLGVIIENNINNKINICKLSSVGWMCRTHIATVLLSRELGAYNTVN